MWLGFVVAALVLAVPLFIFVEAPFMRLRASRKNHALPIPSQPPFSAAFAERRVDLINRRGDAGS
jgi:peptidoglycan/LPS O-acetylase OafA/YrhL